MAEKLSHVDKQGRPRMVDISGKGDTQREAVAGGLVRMKAETLKLLLEGGLAKGDALVTAQLAGIMAAKQTPSLIPLCHPVLLAEVQVELVPRPEENAIAITARAKSLGKTGVEMEALVAVTISALTIYDMCKAVDRGIRIEAVRLIRKSGGKSGTIELE